MVVASLGRIRGLLLYSAGRLCEGGLFPLLISFEY